MHFIRIILIGTLCFYCCPSKAQTLSLKARNLGIPFEVETGKFNAITDVPGLEVGYKTLIIDTGKLVRGKGPVRTGVTVILPKGKTDKS